MATQIRLEYPCPIKLNPTFDTSGKYACTHCHKNVVDFTGKNEQAIQHILSDTDFDACGVYRNVYYGGLPGRIQTRLVKKVTALRANRRSWTNKMVWPLVLLMAFLMSCRTRLAGAYSVRSKVEPTHKQQLDTNPQ